MLNDNDIITIDVSIFQKQLGSFNNLNISPSSLKKKQELESSYSCFLSNHENKITEWIEKKHHQNKYWKDHKHYVTPKPNNRLHILPSNFTEEDKSKKKFTGFLNKLTESNSSTIIPQIQQEISNSSQKDVLYKIIWNFIEKSSEKKYIQLLNYYDKEYNMIHFKKYISDNEWYPSEYILNKNILNLSENEYDIYCQYVKWKKQQINILKGWCSFWDKKENIEHFETLTGNIVNFLESILINISKEKKHLADYCLEYLFVIMNHNKYEKYSERLHQIPLSNLESSSKFLLKNLLEI